MSKDKQSKSELYEIIAGPFRKNIKERELKIDELLLENQTLKDNIHILSNTIEQKEDWIRRLLECADMSEEDMKILIKKDKALIDGADSLKKLMGITDLFDGFPSIKYE